MNTTAVLLGLLYGIISTILCYVVSMVTSGMFSRPFYRLYSRILIGICSVMLLSPVLRWLAATHPKMAVVGLTAAQYLVMGVLGYGVLRFNRDYMKKVFLKRSTTAYFTFGTLANAAIVTLGFLHIAVTGERSWAEMTRGYITAGNYGPLFVLLAGLIFHTDHCLKQSIGNARKFTRFTFIGYGISFLGIGLSLVPYVGKSLGKLQLVAFDSPLLQNFFSVQALLLAIFIYGCLVWHYESTPPLFLLLLAIIAEYHILVTQWVTDIFGPAAWGVASLPLFAGLVGLDHYFAAWDRRKHKTAETLAASEVPAETLRFALPFRIIGIAMAIALFSVTLWTRFQSGPDPSGIWLAVTFALYAAFFVVLAIACKRAKMIYLSGLLVVLAALLGGDQALNDASMAIAGVLGTGWSILAWMSSRNGFKQHWRVPIADIGFLSALIVTAIVTAKHAFGDPPFHFTVVNPWNAVALGSAFISFLIAAYLYRSWCPVFASLFALSVMTPPWNAFLGLVAVITSELIQRNSKRETQHHLENRLRLFGRKTLPLADVLPNLYTQPLSFGAIPLVLLGLLNSSSNVFQGQFNANTLLETAFSASALLLLTNRFRWKQLYLLGLLATYFSLHTIAQGLVFHPLRGEIEFSAHLLLASLISTCGWIVAAAYAKWCGAFIARVAESEEQAYRAKRSYYSGMLYSVSGFASLGVLVMTIASTLADEGSTICLMGAATLSTIVMAAAASLYRSQFWSYLALAGISAVFFLAADVFQLPEWHGAPVLAGIAAAIVASVIRSRQASDVTSRTENREQWVKPFRFLRGSGLQLWLVPVTLYSIACSLTAVYLTCHLRVLPEFTLHFETTAPVTYGMAAIAIFLTSRISRSSPLYLLGITLLFTGFQLFLYVNIDLGELATQQKVIHLLLACLFSLIACMIATTYAGALGKRERHADETKAARINANREFYAGTLVHFAFATCLIALLGVFALSVDRWLDATNPTFLDIFASLLLAATFAFMSWIYQSRLQTYLALTATCLAIYSLNHLLAPINLRPHTLTLVIASASVLFGLVSWSLNRITTKRNRDDGIQKRDLDCWRVPPLPLVSTTAESWSISLVNVAVLLGITGLVMSGHSLVVKPASFDNSWFTITSIYLLSLGFFIATKTYHFSWMALLFTDATNRSKTTESASIGRSIFLVTSIVTFGIATHATLQTQLLGSATPRLALSMHLVLAASLALAGWLTATLYTFVLTRRVNLHKRDQTSIQIANKQFYIETLHQVSFFVAATALLGCGLLAVPTFVTAGPLLSALALLVFYFVMASFTYRSQVPSYFAIAATVLSATYLAKVIELQWLRTEFLILPTIACLGLGFAVAATLLAIRSLQRFDITLPFPSSKFSAPESLRKLWLEPLRNSALLLSTCILSMLVASRISMFQIDIGLVFALTIYLSVGASAFLLAKLFESPLSSYVGAIVLTFAAIPLWSLLGQPWEHLGIAIAFVALVFWIAGYLAERLTLRTTNQSVNPDTILRLYAKPLTRCSATLASVAMCHALLIWKMDGWHASQASLVITSAMGAITLLLNARSLSVIEGVAWARLMVYLACVSVTGCWLAAYSMTWSMLGGLGLNAAVTAVVLGVIGFVITEKAKAISESDPSAANTRLIFGEPIAHFSCFLAMVAVGMASFTLASAFGPLIKIQTVNASSEAIGSLLPFGFTLLVSSACCFLNTRIQRHIAWLYAGVFFGLVGLISILEGRMCWSWGPLTVNTLLLMNLCVAYARLLQTSKKRFHAILGLPSANCEQPFVAWPVLATTLVLLGQLCLLGATISGVNTAEPWVWIANSFLGCLLYLQVLYVSQKTAYLHAIVGYSLAGALGFAVATGWTITIDVVFISLSIICGIAAATLDRPIGKRALDFLRLPVDATQRNRGERLFSGWAIAFAIIAITLTIPTAIYFQPSYPNVTIVLFSATLATFAGGFRWRNTTSSTIAAILFPCSLLAASLYFGQWDLLIEQAGLIASFMALIYCGIKHMLERRQMDSAQDPFIQGTSSSIATLATIFSISVIALAFYSTWNHQGSLPTAVSLGLATVFWGIMARSSQNEKYAYGCLIGCFASMAYLAHAVFEIQVTNNALAAFVVVGYSFLLYVANVLIGRSNSSATSVFLRPSYYVALYLPVTLCIAIPIDEKASAAFTMLAAGSFYLIATFQSNTRWTIYVAAALFNAGIYLWVPTAQQFTGLFQLYVIPAAVTVIIFTQLHRHDLKPEVLTSIRIAASVAILAVSTFEVFFSKEASLLQFVSVLALSLVGIAVGISLRIKPFVYTGIAFLVLNVIGQLGLQFHQEGGLTRAAILIGVGILVLGIMIFFNIHRERILRRYREFLVDAHWE